MKMTSVKGMDFVEFADDDVERRCEAGLCFRSQPAQDALKKVTKMRESIWREMRRMCLTSCYEFRCRSRGKICITVLESLVVVIIIVES